MYSKTLELLSCGFKPSLICQQMKNIKVKIKLLIEWLNRNKIKATVKKVLNYQTIK